MGDRDNHVLVRDQQGKKIFEFHGLADELEKRFVEMNLWGLHVR
jgi:hypothetical protein